MITVNCEICTTQFKIDSNKNDKDKFYLLCNKCIKEAEVCSKSKCKKLFLLEDSDIKHLKIVYMQQNYTFYLYKDIKHIIIHKYGSIELLQQIIDKNQKSKEKRLKKLDVIKAEREANLKKVFELNKLEYKNYGDCYSYINYGKPDLKEVVENEIKKLQDKNERRITLANALYKVNIQIDENLKSIYEYINKLTDKNLDDVVRCIEVEHFLKYNTEYDQLCKQYDKSKARDMALSQYTSKKSLPENIDTGYNKIKLDFE